MLRNQGLQVNHQGIGSTPSCSQNVSENASYDTLTEIHPGNYVFYDQMQKIVSGLKGHFRSKKAKNVIFSSEMTFLLDSLTNIEVFMEINPESLVKNNSFCQITIHHLQLIN